MFLYAKLTEKAQGYDSDKEQIKSLESEFYYFVEGVNMGKFSTKICIMYNFVSSWYNSVNFTFYKKVGGVYVEHDIYSDKEYNQYL